MIECDDYELPFLVDVGTLLNHVKLVWVLVWFAVLVLVFSFFDLVQVQQLKEPTSGAICGKKDQERLEQQSTILRSSQGKMTSGYGGSRWKQS